MELDDNPIKAEELGVYDCPYCDNRLVGTFEQAKKHVNLPLGRGAVLPIGFVFGELVNKGDNYGEILVVTSFKQISQFRAYELHNSFRPHGMILSTHDFQYEIERYGSKCDFGWDKEKILDDHAWKVEKYSLEYSPFFQKKFRRGEYFLLTLEQFEVFKQHRTIPEPNVHRKPSLSNDRLIRTFDGIERLLEWKEEFGHALSIPKEGDPLGI